jgi:dethiobiotin synthetase/adenosylmethionine--8-amino-7-oxononanoate aminotransferase
MASTTRLIVIFICIGIDVGKTIVSTGLVRESLRSNSHQNDHRTRYIKPLQCGGDDAEFVQHYSQLEFNSLVNKLETHTIYKWNTPVSPHIASRVENLPRSDTEVIQNLQRLLTMNSLHASDTFIETAGGVLSPSASSPCNTHVRHARYEPATPPQGVATSEADLWGWSTQADLYQQLRFPVILVGDGKLGGISATLSALESLILRGFDVHGIVFIQDLANSSNTDVGFSNHLAVREYASRKLKLRSGLGKALFEDPEQSIISLPSLPPFPQPLNQWFLLNETNEKLEAFHKSLQTQWKQYIQEVQDMPSVGKDMLWWPFTQHGKYKDHEAQTNQDDSITLIDGAYGDHFHVIESSKRKTNDISSQCRKVLFDTCASWWTQGIGHGDSSLALTAAAAAGRYGHVIFPDTVHSPAVNLSKLLLGPKGPGYQWANRVFFSDDGSTAMEIALKMGIRKFCFDRKIDFLGSHSSYTKLTVCAQQGCYHGDTLGVMNVAEPNIFNRGQHPWYEAKGLFLDFPMISFRQGKLEIVFSNESKSLDGIDFENISSVYDVEARISTTHYAYYYQNIQRSWEEYERNSSRYVFSSLKDIYFLPINILISHAPLLILNSLVASVILEPLLLGAGGMKFVDPLWQRVLIDIAREKCVPVIFDEVASGLFRLGAMSCREILKANPDIAAYAKVLTGGVVPMSVTLASEDIFSAFLGDSKSNALLHGHSYSAHPVGCAVSIHALETYHESLGCQEVKAMTLFDESRVSLLSELLLVKESMSLGTILAVRVGSDHVDSSRIVQAIIKSLRGRGYFARPLGDVIYLMTSFFATSDQYSNLISSLYDTILDVERNILDRSLTDPKSHNVI